MPETKESGVWHIEMLGGLRARRGTVCATRFPTRRAAALLARLACYPNRTHPREEIIELLWPEADLQTGRQNLRQTLLYLRRTLSGEDIPFLQSDNRGIWLEPDALSTDVAAFENAFRQAKEARDNTRLLHLMECISRYSGDFLPGFYDDWAIAERRRLAIVCEDALKESAHLLEASGESGRAAECAVRLVSLDPLNEEYHQLAIQLFLAAGNPSQARKQYEELARLLPEHIVTPPSEELTALLKDIPVQTPVQTIVLSQPPPLTAKPPYPTRRRIALPEPLTDFVEREDVTRVAQWVTQSGRYLLTLTGVGGIGKTRLALAAAQRIADDQAYFREGIVFADLAPLARDSNEDIVCQTIAEALGLSAIEGSSPRSCLSDFLSGREYLLILDNCEHLLPVCATVATELLTASRGSRILATSREPLNLPGECVVAVPPLPLPVAVQLFENRARETRDDFALTPATEDAVARICRQLDGVPLAIEMAAAWVRSLTPVQISERLADCLWLAAGRSAAVPERQRTLRSTLDWSYDLLTTTEQDAFRRLSVFAGGCTLEAAEAICAIPNVLTVLSGLVDRSLILAKPQQDGIMRYGMLEPVRQYAAGRLHQSKEPQEEQETRNRHVVWFDRLAQEAGQSGHDFDEYASLPHLYPEWDNLRAALSWGDAPTALRLAVNLVPFWFVHGYRSEGVQYLTDALTRTENCEQDNKAIRAKAFVGKARLIYVLHPETDTSDLFELALSHYRASGDVRGQADALYYYGYHTLRRGDAERADALVKQSMELALLTTDERHTAHFLNRRGIVDTYKRDYESAELGFRAALVIFRRLEHRIGEQVALFWLGVNVQSRGDLASAEALYEEALALSRITGYRHNELYTLKELSAVARKLGQIDRARSLAEESLTLASELGEWMAEALALRALGAAQQEDGQYAAAQTSYHRALAILVTYRAAPGVVAWILADFASLRMSEQRFTEAAVLYGLLESIEQNATLRADPNFLAGRPNERETLRARLGETALQKAWWEGANSNLEHLLANPSLLNGGL